MFEHEERGKELSANNLNKISLHKTIEGEIPAFSFKSTLFMAPAGQYSEKWKLFKHLVEISSALKRRDCLWIECAVGERG